MSKASSTLGARLVEIPYHRRVSVSLAFRDQSRNETTATELKLVLFRTLSPLVRSCPHSAIRSPRYVLDTRIWSSAWCGGML